MAQADGSIVFETKIDNSDAQKGLNQLQREIAKTEKNISSLEGKRSSISEQFEQASDSANEAQLKIRRMKAELQQAQAALDSKQGFDMPLEEFMRYQAIVADMPGEIAKQESEFEKLVSTVDKLNQKLISYDDQLSQANETLAQQTTQAGELTRQLSVGEPGAPDSSPKASQKETAKSAEQAAKGFTRMREAADKAKGSVSGLARAGAAIGRTVVAGVKAAASAFAAMGRAAVTAFAAAGRGILSFVGHMNVFSRLTSGLGGKISRLGTMIKQAFVFNVISQGLNALRSQMSAYLSTNAAFSGALSNLQASLSTAFQPILDAAVPALVTLMNVLSSVITVIGRFLAALASIGGRAKTNTKALGAQAKATGGAGGAAEKAAKSLAKFDEINRLADDSAGGGGGGGGGGGDFDVDDFPEYEFDGVFKTWGEAFNAFLDTIIDDGLPRLRKALNEFAVGVNTFSANVYEMFTFPGVQEKIRYIGKEIALAFNDMVARIEWELLGRALGAGLNFALGFLVSNLYTFNWFDLGKSLAAAFNGLADEVSWYEFGQLLWAGFKIGLETLAGFIAGLDMPEIANAFNQMARGWFESIQETIATIPWAEIGAKIGQFFSNIEWSGWFELGKQTLLMAVQGILDAVNAFITNAPPEMLAAIGLAIVSIFVGTKVKIIAAIAGVLVLLQDKLGEIGATLGTLFYESLSALLDAIANFDWAGFATNLAEGINNAIAAVKWGPLGEKLGNALISILNGLRTFIAKTDWAAIGSAVAQFLSDIPWVPLLQQLGGIIGDALIAALDLLIGFTEEFDWYGVAYGLWEGLVAAVQEVDWNAVISKIFELLGAAVAALGAIVLGLAKGIWDSIVNALAAAGDYFNDKIEECGGNVVAGIFKGIGDAILGIGAWINDNIFKPFIDGFKAVFGIHSPSTVMEEQGGFIIQGLLQGLTQAWTGIVSFFSEKLEGIKTAISNAWTAIKNTASTAWTNIKTFLGNTWNNLKTTAGTVFNAAKDAIGRAWENTKSFAVNTWNSLKSVLSNTWNNIKSTASSTFTAVKDKIGEVWTNVKTFASDTWNNISTGLSDKWNGIKNAAVEKFNLTKDAIGQAWEAAHTEGKTTWDIVSDSLGKLWDGLKNNASDKFTQIKDKITGAWRDSQRETDQKMDAIAIKVGAQAGFALKSVQDNFSKVSSAITTPLNSAKTTVQGLGWYGLGSNIVEGISAGVRAKAAALANSVANAAYNSLQAAKNVLGINSPSRLFRDIIGLGIVEGTAVGVEENQRMVDNSINSMADGVIGTFSDVLDIVDIWKTLRAVTAETWKMIELDLTTVWQRISQAAAMSFATLYKLVLSSFSSMGESISFAVDGVVENVRRMSDGIMQSVSQAVAGFYTLTNAAADAARMMSFIGSSLPTPRLAGGGVIPQSREFLSVVSAEGGQSGVTEDAIRRIVREEAGGDNTGLLQAILDAVRAGHIIMVDRHVLGKTVTQEQNRMTRASGRSALLT